MPAGPRSLTSTPNSEASNPPAGIDPADFAGWLTDTERVHGRQLLVTPLPPGVWEHRDPIEELCDKVGPERVIVVEVSDDGGQP
jgi:hypothetical protein